MRRAHSGLTRTVASLTFLASLVASAAAQAQVPAPASVVSVTLRSVPEKPAAGAAFKVTAEVEIASGWHINSHTPKEDYLIPTELAIPKLDGIGFADVTYPAHVERKFSFSEKPVAVYEGKVVFTVEGRVTAGAKPGPRALEATVSYQACNDQQCLAPTSVSGSVSLEVVAGSAATAGTTASKEEPSASPAATAGSQPLPASTLRERWQVKGVPTLVFLGTDGKEHVERITGFQPPDAFLKHLSGDGSKSASGPATSFPLFLVFLSGLALNLTPCVYPLIPITLGFFGRQNAGKTSRTFGLALAYVLGMCVTYSSLGVFAALSGSLFGSWLQKPIVLVVIALVVVALSLSMFGLFEIQTPGFIADRAGSKTGFLGALTMGLFVGFVAAPCIGPFVLSLLTFVAQQGSALVGFTYFFTLALGLGLPYLVLGTVSGSLQKLPRSGEWMVAVRKVFGFALLALAVYFLRPVLPERVFELGMAIPLAVGGFYFLFFEKSSPKVPWFRVAKIAVAIVLLTAGVVLAIPGKAKNELRFEKYSEAAVEAARAAGKPVMIDFYADWCLPCRELDHKTFTDPEVIKKLDGWVLLKADLTK